MLVPRMRGFSKKSIGGGVLIAHLGAPIAYHVFFAPAAPNDLRALVVKSTVRAKVNGVTLK